MSTRGRFISFEGSEGCGKSTQLARLRARLEAEGKDVLLTREPGGTPAGERIRDLLQHDPEGEGLTPEAELLLFAASRAQLVREVILPALDAGTWVLADRFLDSTTVYQGVGRGLDLAAVSAINGFAVGDCLPDTTILLDLSVAEGRARIGARDGGAADRMEREPDSFFEKVRAGYLELAAANPERFAVLDASATVDDLEVEITKALEI
jgi:dTMP kinase